MGAEGVDGPGEQPLEMRQRGLEAGAPRRLGLVAQPALELELEPRAQLGRRLAREGDGGHALDLVASGRDARGHPAGEALRLAGSGARLDEQRQVELALDE